MLISELIHAYQTDPASPYHARRYMPRKHADGLCRFLAAEFDGLAIADIRTRDVLEKYKQWVARIAAKGKSSGIPMGHAIISQLRTLAGFGASLLEDQDCQNLSVRLHVQRFAMGKPRTEIITAEQATAIRRKAHAMGFHSIALAQAAGFECMARQKDIIGEWIPKTERGRNYLVVNDWKWFCGLRYEEIDTDLILRHITSKRQKEITVDLKLAPMVMEEFYDKFGLMTELPRHGPVIICERTGLPWHAASFRRQWRIIARACGIPDTVKHMDTRAGSATEALASGARLQAVRKAMTHSDESMTQKYSRDDHKETAEVMMKRAAHRASGGI
jgi:integrase